MAVEFSVRDEPVDDDTHVVAVSGEIDIFTAPEFKTLLADTIDAGRKLVVVDLTETTFIDSSSLGVLISAHRRLDLREGRLVVVCDKREVRNTFKITGLDSVLTVVGTRDEALAAGSGESPVPEAA